MVMSSVRFVLKDKGSKAKNRREAYLATTEFLHKLDEEKAFIWSQKDKCFCVMEISCCCGPAIEKLKDNTYIIDIDLDAYNYDYDKKADDEYYCNFLNEGEDKKY